MNAEQIKDFVSKAKDFVLKTRLQFSLLLG